MKGWRARLGFLIPPGNPTVEPEMIAMAPPGVSVHFSRSVAIGWRAALHIGLWSASYIRKQSVERRNSDGASPYKSDLAPAQTAHPPLNSALAPSRLPIFLIHPITCERQ